ncbi:MAG: 1-deoxy-D-xylulose-5-phosphate reductoisomerase [Hyphomicrobiaceae bacterium]|nr:1-deoxy-D-xylulose-5-phosphate reductoisomerase [Hyphomicrobiaceae bacterium]
MAAREQVARAGREAETAPDRSGVDPGSPIRRISVLGATGSIGQSTLDLVARHRDRFQVEALTANADAAKLADLAIRHNARLAVVADPSAYEALTSALAGTGITAAAGPQGLEEAASRPADCVVAAIVGAAGLVPTLAAVRQGRRIALANKECLVTAGTLFMAEVASSGAELLPVDSEHSAAFQAIGMAEPDAIEQITLTASGGPFRAWSLEQLKAATPEQALRHPNWSMGAKITIDSATLMNKGLELIEAYHLFPVEAHQLSCVVHPQSIVHCLVSYRDGSVLAQLSSPDMRTPIALALSWPRRIDAPTKRLDLAAIGQLTFDAPDETRFPALGLARGVLAAGGAAPAVLNAANEVAVAAFLERRIGFLEIARTVAECLDAAHGKGLLRAAGSIDEVLSIDREARGLARSLLSEG